MTAARKTTIFLKVFSCFFPGVFFYDLWFLYNALVLFLWFYNGFCQGFLQGLVFLRLRCEERLSSRVCFSGVLLATYFFAE